MASLKDIAPLRKQVAIRDQAFTVRGLSLEMIVDALFRFPEVEAILTGGSRAADLSFASLIGNIPGAASWAIAAGIVPGEGEPATEEADVDNLTISEQAEVIEAIGELTFSPGGPAPLFARLLTWISYLPKPEPAAAAVALPNGAAMTEASNLPQSLNS